MRIAIFADNFLPQVNGVVTAILNLSKGLAKKGHKVLIIAPKYSKFEYPKFHPNIEILNVRSVPALIYHDLKFTSVFNKKILSALRKKEIEILHFHAPMTLGLQAVMFAKILKLPLIGTFHTFFAESDYLKHARLDYEIVQKISWQFINLYYNRCDLITCPSQNTKKILMGNNCIKPIKVISNGIDPGLFDNTKSQEIKKKYNPNGPLCLFVGRIAYEKNVDFLIEAFAEVAKKMPAAKLLIVGDGPQFKSIQNKIQQMGLIGNIILLGGIEYKILVKSGIYKACDIFITASKTENQSLTMLEAQVNGLPCVGMNAKGTPDLLKDGINGFLVENEDKKTFAEAILKLLQNQDLLEQMKQNTLKMVKHHHIKNIIRVWEKTYTEVLKNHQQLGKNSIKNKIYRRIKNGLKFKA